MLGPRYTLTYRLEGPGIDDEIVQDVYPYAEPRPLTHLPPGRYPNMRGTWFVADEDLTTALVDTGLPRDVSPSEGGLLLRAVIWSLAVFAAGLVVTLMARPRLKRPAQARTT